MNWHASRIYIVTMNKWVFKNTGLYAEGGDLGIRVGLKGLHSAVRAENGGLPMAHLGTLRAGSSITRITLSETIITLMRRNIMKDGIKRLAEYRILKYFLMDRPFRKNENASKAVPNLSRVNTESPWQWQYTAKSSTKL